MLQYQVETMARSFDGQDRQNKRLINNMPDNGMVSVDLNALRKGQYYKITLLEAKAESAPAPKPEPKVEPKPEPAPTPADQDPDKDDAGGDGTNGEPLLD